MDFFIYVFLAWLLDNIRYIGRPPWFFFTTEYWAPKRAAKAQRKRNTVWIPLLSAPGVSLELLFKGSTFGIKLELEFELALGLEVTIGRGRVRVGVSGLELGVGFNRI